MKKELKHLAPYLPYELKGIWTDSIDGSSHETSITGVGETANFGMQVMLLDNGGVGYSNFDEIKPILRPLSDLTKPIIKDEDSNVIHLMELAKIAFPKTKKYTLVDNYIELGVEYSFHLDQKEVSFDCMRGFDGKRWSSNHYVPNQLQLFEYLYEHHFDVFGLIPEGLAIDINTIKQHD